MNHHLGMELSFSAMLAELDDLTRELHGTVDCRDRMTDAHINCSLRIIEKHARNIASFASAGQSYLAHHLNRHAVAAE